MGLSTWSKSEVEYGRRVLHSGLEGARTSGEAFLEGRPLAPFLGVAARSALKPAAIGACLGALAGSQGDRQKSIARVFAFGLLGGVLGFGAGLAWQNRRLAACVARGALRNIDKVCNEHWLQKHPIDYA